MTPMPKTVLAHRIKIKNMSDTEKKTHFKGKSIELLRSMAWRHGYGPKSDEYARHHDGKSKDERNITKINEGIIKKISRAVFGKKIAKKRSEEAFKSARQKVQTGGNPDPAAKAMVKYARIEAGHNEDTINELSHKILHRYVKKTRKAFHDDPDMEDRRTRNRWVGLHTAKKKLGKAHINEDAPWSGGSPGDGASIKGTKAPPGKPDTKLPAKKPDDKDEPIQKLGGKTNVIISPTLAQSANKVDLSDINILKGQRSTTVKQVKEMTQQKADKTIKKYWKGKLVKIKKFEKAHKVAGFKKSYTKHLKKGIKIPGRAIKQAAGHLGYTAQSSAAIHSFGESEVVHKDTEKQSRSTEPLSSGWARRLKQHIQYKKATAAAKAHVGESHRAKILDELSAHKLTSYIKKSYAETQKRGAHSYFNSAEARANKKQIDKRRTGINNALNKLDKEEYVNELSNDKLTQYAQKAVKTKDDDPKFKKHQKGLSKAFQKVGQRLQMSNSGPTGGEAISYEDVVGGIVRGIVGRMFRKKKTAKTAIKKPTSRVSGTTGPWGPRFKSNATGPKIEPKSSDSRKAKIVGHLDKLSAKYSSQIGPKKPPSAGQQRQAKKRQDNSKERPEWKGWNPDYSKQKAELKQKLDAKAKEKPKPPSPPSDAYHAKRDADLEAQNKAGTFKKKKPKVTKVDTKKPGKYKDFNDPVDDLLK